MPLIYNTDLEIKYERNRIVFGAPGTGKSFNLKKDCEACLKDTEGSYERVTFHPDYTYSQFVGTYKPVSDGTAIRYEFVPGPFMRVYVEAMKSARSQNPQPHILIIEEINRGNAAAIFGDTFQLLDRKNGDSEYPINNEFLESYLKENLENIESLPSNYNLERIMIPHNLTIFATMNTSDQNVFPLDTAFKRRWNRERMTNDWGNVGHIKEMYVPYTDITWETFAKTINKEMISQSIKKDAPISEDKQMGAYFANEDMLTDGPMEKDDVKLKNFENNILDYLYNDVTKFDHSILFEKQLNSIDNIYERINLYIDAINDTGAEQAESKCVFNKVFVDEITEQMLGFVTKADDSDD